MGRGRRKGEKRQGELGGDVYGREYKKGTEERKEGDWERRRRGGERGRSSRGYIGVKGRKEGERRRLGRRKGGGGLVERKYGRRIEREEEAVGRRGREITEGGGKEGVEERKDGEEERRE
jgi:hypothetical protein